MEGLEFRVVRIGVVNLGYVDWNVGNGLNYVGKNCGEKRVEILKINYLEVIKK